MNGLSDLLQIINSQGRKVYVSERLIDLRELSVQNEIYVLVLPDGSTAAGGRAGGYGERRIVKLYRFACGGGSCRKVAEYEDDEHLDALDLPYHATAMPLLDEAGKEKLVSGVVDPEFARSYRIVLG